MHIAHDPICISGSDAALLRQSLRNLSTLPPPDHASALQLKEKLAHAHIAEDDALPRGTITLGTLVEIEYCDDGTRRLCRPVLPHEADQHPHNVSILAPLALALLGASVGDEVHWPLAFGLGTLDVRILRLLSGNPSRNQNRQPA